MTHSAVSTVGGWALLGESVGQTTLLGFAVVADEVKSLAEESQQRADEIDDSVDELTSG